MGRFAFCVDMGAHEGKLEADGGRVNGMHWVLEEEEGCREEELFIGSVLQKKLLMALLHDWAFVTTIVLPATSATGTVLSASQLLINHLGTESLTGSFKSI